MPSGWIAFDPTTGADPDTTASPSLPFIAIATTLSAAEFTSGAGVTDERGPGSRYLVYLPLEPDIVILDPEVTTHTPPRLWFSTGIRALDHALETWCSTNPTPLPDAHSSYAARLLLTSLPQGTRITEPHRCALELGRLALDPGRTSGVKAGASHGMGHALGGTAGMPHGETSCVMLPHVLRYNAR